MDSAHMQCNTKTALYPNRRRNRRPNCWMREKTAAFLQLLKETAMRSGEANNLLWSDVDVERRSHRKVETTLLYIQLAEAIFKETTDEFTVRVASKPEEIKQLLEVGFDFVCEKDELLYFRKRK